MKVEQPDEKTLKITDQFATNQNTLYTWLTEPYKMTLWLADHVESTPTGFQLELRLPLHHIKNRATIITEDPPDCFEFVWNSEYVMNPSLVSYNLVSSGSSVTLEVTETGDFDQSRWSDPQGIHIDLWKNSLQRLHHRVD